MADCIQYLIAENLLTVLKNIKTVNGYNHNVPDTNIVLGSLYTSIPDSTKQAIFLDIIESEPIEDQGHTIVETYHYMVRFYNVHTQDNPKLAYDNRNVVSDVVKAVKADVTRGGYAQYTEKGLAGHAIDTEVDRLYSYVLFAVKVAVNSRNPYSTTD